MKKYIFVAVAAIAVLSSCSKEDDYTTSTRDSGAFYATIEEGSTRTTLGDADADGKCKVLWKADDAISINGVTYTATTVGSNATRATFTTDAIGTMGTTGTTFKAYYPASIYNGGTLTLPATQTYDATTNGISNLPMYAESTDHNLVFKNLCAVLAITVKNIYSVSSIEVKSDKQMNGAFTASADGTLTFTSKTLSAADKKVTLTFSEPKVIGSGTTFYVAVPPNSAHNFIIKVTGNKGTKAMGTMTAEGINIARNTIYPVTFTENAVQLWENGPYWATINVGQTHTNYSTIESGASYRYETLYVGGLYTWCGTVDGRPDYGKTNQYTDDHYTGNYSYDYDTARKLWGASWRMPTKDELVALQDDVTGVTKESSNMATGTIRGLQWTWVDGKYSWYVYPCPLAGYKVNGKYDSNYYSNSIFLALSGYNSNYHIINNYTDYSDNVLGRGMGAGYWSSTHQADDEAYSLGVAHDAVGATTANGYVNVSSGTRKDGYSIRAVLNE